MKSLLLLTTIAFAASALAGCIDDAGELLDDGTGVEGEMAFDPALRIEATNCIQGGGNSVYEMTEGETKIGPFLARDQNPEIGDPMIGAFGDPVDTPSHGIWHTATICEQATYLGKTYDNFAMGWIAEMIMPPAEVQTATPARLDYFVADLSFTIPEFVALTREVSNGAEISDGVEYVVEWTVPDRYMHVVLSEANHGTFDFTAEIHKEFGPKETEKIRFWQLAAVGGAHGHAEEEMAPGIPAERGEGADTMMYRPVYFDITQTMRDGPVMKKAGESAGTFTHVVDIQEGNVPHVGNPLGHYQSGFDMVIEFGGAPEGVFYDNTWLH